MHAYREIQKGADFLGVLKGKNVRRKFFSHCGKMLFKIRIKISYNKSQNMHACINTGI